MRTPARWDIFCKVIDNHGDIGVCWRLATQLARRGHRVRLWIDDASALEWMAPQGEAGVEVLAWPACPDQVEAAANSVSVLGDVSPGDVVIEAFGCTLDEPFIAAMAGTSAGKKFAMNSAVDSPTEAASTADEPASRAPAWVNLEYLSAENWVERSHGLMSPVMSGPGAGLAKHFFYPGFTERTGGLLRGPDLLERQARFDRTPWLLNHGVDLQPGDRVISLFCYEPVGLPDLLRDLAGTRPRTHVLVTAGRATAAVLAASAGLAALPQITFLPLLDQADYDHLLWSADLNFVRGEDSLVRALWAGKPFVWHIYPQDDDAHHAKLEAFLDWADAPETLRHFSRVWNAVQPGPLPALNGSSADFLAWQTAAQKATNRAAAQPDLVTQLEAFIAGTITPPNTPTPRPSMRS